MKTNEKIFCVYGLEELILLKRYSTQSNLQSQCSPYQNSSGIFHRNGTNNPKNCIKCKTSEASFFASHYCYHIHNREQRTEGLRLDTKELLYNYKI